MVWWTPSSPVSSDFLATGKLSGFLESWEGAALDKDRAAFAAFADKGEGEEEAEAEANALVKERRALLDNIIVVNFYFSLVTTAVLCTVLQ